MDTPKVAPTADEIYKLVKENNQMLKAMRRDSFIKSILGFVWWFIILIVLPYLSWLFIQPYLKSVTDAYTQVQSTNDSINATIKGLPDLTKLLEQFSGGGN